MVMWFSASLWHYCLFQAKVRKVRVRARGSSDKEPVSLLTFLVADRTGPVLCEAWREVGDHLFQQFSVWQSQAGDDEAMFVQSLALRFVMSAERTVLQCGGCCVLSARRSSLRRSHPDHSYKLESACHLLCRHPTLLLWR